MKDPISAYAAKLTPPQPEICAALRGAIETALPAAIPKIWHGHPVWFVREHPVVGYNATAKDVRLLFWNGQSFGEPALVAVGKFKAAQLRFTEAAQIEAKLLRRCLKKAGTDIWDYAGVRRPRPLPSGT